MRQSFSPMGSDLKHQVTTVVVFPPSILTATAFGLMFNTLIYPNPSELVTQAYLATTAASGLMQIAIGGPGLFAKLIRAEATKLKK